MKEIKITGQIIFKNIGDWERLLLKQKDGSIIDLVYRFNEMQLSHPKASATVSYFISNKPLSESELIESHIKKVFGTIDSKYGITEEVVYSEYTKDPMEYWTNLDIGGHSLLWELRGSKGKYLFIRIKITKQ